MSVKIFHSMILSSLFFLSETQNIPAKRGAAAGRLPPPLCSSCCVIYLLFGRVCMGQETTEMRETCEYVTQIRFLLFTIGYDPYRKKEKDEYTPT